MGISEEITAPKCANIEEGKWTRAHQLTQQQSEATEQQNTNNPEK